MKKLLSFFMAFAILISSCFAVDFSSFADDKAMSIQSKGMYKVSEKVYADAYMLINLDDDSYPVIASKNAEKKKFPASLTKIVTAIVAINNIKDLQAKTTVSRYAIESLYGTYAQVAGLHIGDEVTMEELLYLTMVHSACDACQVLAEAVAGSVDAFVDMMNEYVKSLGCTDTHFTNDTGLHDDNHYTTARDMAIITLDAMKSDVFNTVSSTQLYEFNNQTFVHTNLMLDRFHVSYYYEYASGIKTGSTTEAGYCVITKASKDGYNYLAVVMDSPIKNLDGYDTKCSFIDAATLFDWAFDGLKYSTVIRQNEVVAEIPVNNGKDSDTVQLISSKDVTTIVPKSLDASAVIVEPVNPPKSLDAPVTQGDFICNANIIYANQVIAETKLVAAKTVELSTFLKIMNALKRFFSNKIVILAIFILILGFIAYLVIFVSKAQKKKKHLAEKRRRQELEDQANGYSRRNDFDDLAPPKRR